MQKIRKYSGWQNHVSRTAVVASDTLDHDLDACHIFIYETSRVSSIKNKKTNHTTFRARNWSKQWYERFNKSIISLLILCNISIPFRWLGGEKARETDLGGNVFRFFFLSAELSFNSSITKNAPKYFGANLELPSTLPYIIL